MVPDVESPRGWKLNLALVPVLAAVLLPKCPFCLAAYLSVFGLVGMAPSVYGAWLLPVTSLALAVALAVLAFRAPTRQGYGPLVLGVAAAALLLVGKFCFVSVSLGCVGIALLAGASIWNAWPQRKPPPGCCG